MTSRHHTSTGSSAVTKKNLTVTSLQRLMHRFASFVSLTASGNHSGAEEQSRGEGCAAGEIRAERPRTRDRGREIAGHDGRVLAGAEEARPAFPTEDAAPRSFVASARARNRGLIRCVAVAMGLFLTATSVPAASAAGTESPWWHLNTSLRPANLAPGGKATLVAEALNVGDAPAQGPVALSATLPPGTRIVEEEGVPQVSYYVFSFAEAKVSLGPPNFGPLFCETTATSVTCTSHEEIGGEPFLSPNINPYEYVEIRVEIEDQGATAPAAAEVAVTGGGAPQQNLHKTLPLSATGPVFGVEEFSLRPEEEGGGLASAAGSHPFQLTTTVNLNQTPDPARPPALPRNLDFALPPGMIGNATAVPHCSEGDFSALVAGGFANLCPDNTAIGVASVVIDEPHTYHYLSSFSVPLFNLAPGRGEPARFGFEVAKAPVILDTSLRSGPGEDYGVTVSATNITQLANLLSSNVTFWGSPADPRHDSARGWGCMLGEYWRNAAAAPQTCTASTEFKPPAFLTLPTNCTDPFSVGVSGISWPNLADPAGTPLAGVDYTLRNETAEPQAMSACNQLSFAPRIRSMPTTTSPSAPTGLNFDLEFENPGLESSEGLAESQVKKAVVALPVGVTTNPAVAGGLTACSEADYEAENLTDEAGCPQSSKVGEVEIQSPLVKPTIDGSIYVARQAQNPNHNLLTIYMVAKNPELGILVRSAGKVEPNPQNGQLTTTFDNLPQLPFSHFHLHFREGQRAPLIAPGLCGKYTTQASLYSYADPDAAIQRQASFEVAAPCATQASQLPNKPSLEAGTTSPIAGAYSPFVFRVRREDGSQTLSSISATLPEGLLGKLAGIKECSNAQIAQAEGRGGEGQGALELTQPSCPASSEVGTVNVATGVGPQPYYVAGKAYLADPYKGAPLSLAIITPAVVGPFDFGTIVVRTALYVDEVSTQITAKSDPIPTIVHGLPTVVQSIALNMNRPNFTLNPTSCDLKQITGSATSTLGNVAPLSERFQVGACNALGFAPKLVLNLKGGTRRSTFPALKATLTYPKGSYANIKRAQVTLPHSEFLEQGHIGTVCTRVQFAAKACPKASIYGKARAISPLLDRPLSGPVYLRSSSNKLPDLVAELNGQIDVTLDGKIDTGKGGGIRNTFQAVPDAPISKFVLELKGGKKGLLVNSKNLCSPQAEVNAIADFTAQNGKVHNTTPTVTNSCVKKSKDNKKSKGHKPRKASQ
jgi:hypothetical protein